MVAGQAEQLRQEGGTSEMGVPFIFFGDTSDTLFDGQWRSLDAVSDART